MQLKRLCLRACLGGLATDPTEAESAGSASAGEVNGALALLQSFAASSGELPFGSQLPTLASAD